MEWIEPAIKSTHKLGWEGQVSHIWTTTTYVQAHHRSC